MKQAPHLETLSQTTQRNYDDLVKEHGQSDCERWFGGYTGLMQIIKDGQLNDLVNWLAMPSPDWQRDC